MTNSDDQSSGSVASANRKLRCLPVKSEQDVSDERAQLERAGTYELLSRLLAATPDDEVVGVLRDMPAIDPSQGQMAMGWELLRKAAIAATPASIKEEYFNLFIGLGRGELVPFGSWYLTGFLMEKPVSELRADLQRLGIARQEGVRNSEDHIAGVCDAMAIMIRHSDELDFTTQQQFFGQHVATWAGDFFADLQQAEAATFYRAVGFLGESFCNIEHEYFSMQA